MERQESASETGESPSTPRLSSQRPLMMVASPPPPKPQTAFIHTPVPKFHIAPPVEEAIEEQDFHEEHTESLAMVGIITNGARTAADASLKNNNSLEELKRLVQDIPTHTFAHFLALIYASTMVSLVTDLSPSWMICIIATISLGMFYHFKL